MRTAIPVDIEHLTVDEWCELKKDSPQDCFTVPRIAPALAPEVENHIAQARKAKNRPSMKWLTALLLSNIDNTLSLDIQEGVAHVIAR